MVDVSKRSGEEGTTLVELLVVIMLLGVIGAVTTAGIVTSFNTQLTATRGAESLDELRLSVQRIRDNVRGADEVCASSDGGTLAIWTDRDDAGVLGDDEDVEVVIFEVDPATDHLTRRTRNSGTTTLISDVIVTPGGDVFSYDIAPTAQEADLVCDTALVTSPSTAVTTRVTLDIQVANADGVNTVDTVTTMRLRNAGLADVTSGGGAGSSNDPPTASVNLPAQCFVDEPCPLDGEGTDPEGPLTFAWDLDADGVFDEQLVEDPSPVFSTLGTATVALRVTDDAGQTATASGTIEIVAAGTNLAPVAAFTYECTGPICMFDADSSAYLNSSEATATESSDVEDAQDALIYVWTFAPSGGTPYDSTAGTDQADQTETFTAPSVDVTLRVTDTGGAFDESSATISTSSDTIYVEQLKAVGGPREGGSSGDFTFKSTLTVHVKTTTGLNRENVQVSVDISNANATFGTCTTRSDGKCPILVTADHNNKVTFTINTLRDAGGGTYDPGQNGANTIEVQKNQTETEPSP